MIINSIRLRNIRSYIDEQVELSEGITLLSGDIGCGKSTILLAIEFALFGVMKGMTSGSTLLRHGTNQGFVELQLTIEGKQVTIRRSLKRAVAGIVQDSGLIRTGDAEFQGTPLEMKQRILELLGYPESLLTKSKSLIFRYTVFTPQEEMKKILYENKEDRLDILRRLFNIDKYKRVKENTFNYSRELKNRINFLHGRLEGLADKKEEHQAYLDETERAKQQAQGLVEQAKAKQQELESAKKMLECLEQALEATRKQEQEAKLKLAEKSNLERQELRCRKETQQLDEEIAGLRQGLAGFDLKRLEELKARISARKDELESTDKKLQEILQKKSEYTSKRRISEQLINKIKELDDCPTCHQKVTEEHVAKVTGHESLVIKACESNVLKLEEFEKRCRDRKRQLQQEIDKCQEGERETALLKLRQEAVTDKERRRQALSEELSRYLQEKAKAEQGLKILQASLKDSSSEKAGLDTAKKALELNREQKIAVDRQVAELNAKCATLQKVSAQLKVEIEKLEKERLFLTDLKSKKDWLDEDFICLVDAMEKNMLSRIYNEFNSFFQEWFSTLIEDETISVRLDDYFSPSIEQNGYETQIENLSGGEKTSIALSYRLALNRVINDFLTGIRTRDLIILDEPTEGFSSEQLDRVREVLLQTNVRQTIIVSHEAKMEGFVDKIVRIQKQNHISTLLKLQ